MDETEKYNWTEDEIKIIGKINDNSIFYTLDKRLQKFYMSL